jgi:nucleotide-binding universal stress UspA family protein
MKILTIYDGTLHSKTALQYGLREAKEKRGELVVLQVFQSNLFLDYDAGPFAEEIARAEAARHLRDAEALILGAGGDVVVRVVSVEGNTIEEAIRIAQTEQVDLILSTPRYKAITKNGSLSVRLIPGTLLVPIDNSDALMAGLDGVIDEAKASASKVLLLGIVPIHLYSSEEKKELEQVRKNTADAVRKIKNVLREQHIEVSDVLSSGFPDEEILKAAEKYEVSLIILPAGGKTPSELTKAAAILLDERERVHMPIRLLLPEN